MGMFPWFTLFYLSFLVKNQLRILALRSKRGHHDEIHAGKNPEAPLSAELRIQLIAQIGRSVIQELHASAVRQRIFQIHVFAHERIQLLDLRKSFDVKVVDFFYELFLEFLKLPAIAERFVFLPNLPKASRSIDRSAAGVRQPLPGTKFQNYIFRFHSFHLRYGYDNRPMEF